MSGGSNVAQGKSATQGSTWKNNAYFSASNAIDGDSFTFAHTAMNGDGLDWLEIDLEGTYTIESLSIVNRHMQLFHCSPMRESWLMELGLGIPAEC
jgi:hypothetical protein